MSRTLVGVLACTASLAVGVAVDPTAAAAAPPERTTTNEILDLVFPLPEWNEATFCGFEAVKVRVAVDEVERVQTRRQHPFPYFSVKYSNTVTVTNPDTGLTFTVVERGNGRDLRIVDNEDGTITITFRNTGRTYVYGPDGPDGELLFFNRGLFRETVLIETQGTPDPMDDVFLEPVGEPFTAGKIETGEFCADFLAATTP